MHDPQRNPWTRRYILWGALTCLGAVMALAAIVGVVVWSVSQMEVAQPFPAPGEVTYQAVTTDTVTIWNQVQFAGRGPGAAMAARPPGGLNVHVTQQSSGKELSLDAAPNLVERFNGVTRLSILQFTPPAPGKYVITATGPVCTLAVGSGDARRTMGGMLLGGCGGCFGGALALLGAVMLIVTGVRHSGSKGPAAPIV